MGYLERLKNIKNKKQVTNSKTPKEAINNKTKKTYEIWMEGFRATGERGYAHRVATVKATSFQEACDKYYKNDKLYNSKNLSYWACGLYDNEEDARIAFG